MRRSVTSGSQARRRDSASIVRLTLGARERGLLDNRREHEEVDDPASELAGLRQQVEELREAIRPETTSLPSPRTSYAIP